MNKQTINEDSFNTLALKVLKNRRIEYYETSGLKRKCIAIFTCPKCDWDFECNLSSKNRRAGRQSDSTNPFQSDDYGESPIDEIKFRLKDHMESEHNMRIKDENKE